jgi:FkbM family methyltransferase
MNGVKKHAHLERVARVTRYIWRHPANDGKRMRVLWKSACFQAWSRATRRPKIADLGGQALVWAYPGEPVASAVVYSNIPDYCEMLFWQGWLRRNELFVDVGANIGTYALWAAAQGATAVAVEASPKATRLLRENIRLNPYPISVQECAASSRGGNGRFTSGAGPRGKLSNSGEIEVQRCTLDALIGSRVARGVKIDVEGAELEVLKGGENALREHRIQVLQLEWNELADRRPVADMLMRFGYSLLEAGRDGRLRPLVPPLDEQRRVDNVFAAACYPVR